MATKTYLDRPSLWVALITAILILVIVTVGVLSRFLLDEFASRVVLVTLIVFLSILGIAALTYLEIRKRTVQRQDQMRSMRNGYQHLNIEPSAPKDNGWEYSNRTTLQAS